MSIKNKLNRLKPHLHHEQANSHLDERPPEALMKTEDPFIDVWRKEEVVPFYADGDYCLVREKNYPLDMLHGKYRFLDFTQAVKAWNDSHLKSSVICFRISGRRSIFL